MIWLFAGSGLTKLALAAGGAALLSGPLNTAQTWVSGQSPYTPSAAAHLASTTNVDQLPRLPAVGVIVDLEDWPLTPASQSQDPVGAYRRAAEVGRAYHQWLLATPATDLVRSVDPGYRGKIYPEFVRLRLAARIAPYASVYEIQAQGLERNPTLYRSFVADVSQQVRMAHPGIAVLAGLSTNPGGHPVPASVLERDIALTKGLVSGYWLNIPQAGKACPRCGQAHPEIAVRLLDAELKGSVSDREKG